MPLLRHHLARFSTERFAIATKRTYPLRQPSHDAKSGLALGAPGSLPPSTEPNQGQTGGCTTAQGSGLGGGIESDAHDVDSVTK